MGTPAYLAPEVILTTKGKKYDGKVRGVSCPVPYCWPPCWAMLCLPIRQRLQQGLPPVAALKSCCMHRAYDVEAGCDWEF